MSRTQMQSNRIFRRKYEQVKGDEAGKEDRVCVCVLGVDEKVVKCKTENAQFSALNNAVRWILRIRTCGAKFLGG